MNNLTEEDFDQKVEAEKLAIVWFGVNWCGNCRRLEPLLEEVSKSLDASFYKVDVDNNLDLAGRFGVSDVPVRYDEHGVPTVIIFKEGQEAGRVVGSLQKEQMVEKIGEIIAA